MQAQCGSNVIINLILEKSAFPGNELRRMWLKTDVEINQLIVDNCFLSALSDAVFSSLIYKRTTRLHLLNNNISALRRAIFRHLPNLQHLVIEGNLIRQAERNLLKDVAGTLQCLQFEDVIEDERVLRNITGADELRAVQVLSLRYNHVPIIDSQLFSGVPNVASLYLGGSDVKTIHAGAFESISRSLKQLVLSDNAIASLPEGLFDRIIRQNADFGLTIDNNPWHCDCGLEWMREMITRHPSVMKKNLTCVSPERNAGKTFESADFCDNETSHDARTCTGETASRTVSDASNVLPVTEAAMISVDCVLHHRQVRWNRMRRVSPTIQVPLPFADFSAEQFNNGSVLVTVPDTASSLSLIWFANDARSSTVDLRNSTRCVSQVRGSYLLRDLQPRTSYTICLRDNLSFSPLNCLGLTTRSSSKSNGWFNGFGENEIIAIFVGSLMLVCLASAVLMFVTVRRHPAMLRGSKRVIIVKRRKVMVLPKGISNNAVSYANDNAVPTISQNLENEYVTPLPPARGSIRNNWRSCSRKSSEQSDGTSYISNIEPTLSRFNSWKLKRGSCYMNRETEPPPLPPHPRHKE